VKSEGGARLRIRRGHQGTASGIAGVAANACDPGVIEVTEGVLAPVRTGSFTIREARNACASQRSAQK